MFGCLVALAGAVTVGGLLATLWSRHEELDRDLKLQEDEAAAQAFIAAVGAKRAVSPDRASKQN
jgi:hypothetical protein